MKRLAVLAVVGSLVLLMPTAGRAGMYSVSGTIGANGAASVDPFDSSLGTLTAVSWTADGKLLLSASLTNSTSQDADGSLKFDLKFFGRGPDGTQGDVEDAPGYVDFTLAAGDSNTFTNDTSLTISPFQPITMLSDYEGPGQVDFSFSISDLGAGVQSSNPPTLNSTSASFDTGSTVTVTYTYTPDATSPVPEPGTLILGSIGIAGMAGYGWRRRKRMAA